MQPFRESTVESAALEWFEELGYSVAHGPDIAPGEPQAERASYSDVLLVDRMRDALRRINPHLPEEAREEVIRKLLRTEHPSLIENNRRFHGFLVNGVPVEYQGEGRTIHDHAWLIDFRNPENNDWLVVNQFTVIEDRHNRRADLVVFVNGLPLSVIELKNPADENATVKDAFKQFQTYKAEIPSLFLYNEVLVISDGIEARCGTLTSDWERFMPWRTVDGKELAPKELPQLEVALKGIFEKKRFLELIRHFIVFEATRQGIAKKMASYHQFHAVQKAIGCTLKAVGGDRRAGIIWHTQGSGKSLTMAFYAGKIIQNPAMDNPTLVLLTDRNDLDDQLFGTFSSSLELLRQTPVQAESRIELRDLLKRSSGGVIFTTIQKFLPDETLGASEIGAGGTGRFPLLSERKNIVVIADEAHRSQYDFIEGFARHLRDALPHATFMDSLPLPLKRETGALEQSLETTLTSMTSISLLKTEPLFPFTTKPDWPDSISRKKKSLALILSLKR